MDLMFWFLACISILCVVASVLPFVRLPHGSVRIFDFPRIQVLAVAAVSLAVGFFTLPQSAAAYAMLAGLAGSALLQLWHIARFSPVWPRRAKDYAGPRSKAASVRILVSNVKQNNAGHDRVISMVKSVSPDIAVFMETDETWIRALEPIAGDFPETVLCPQDNTYGMALYSRLRLENRKVQFLLNKEVPSFDCLVEIDNGHRFRLITVHPEPPIPIDDTIGRDAEIAIVGRIVRDEKVPVIVTGDLNDVAWSSTTRRFLRLSRLLDPREGRGLFNTFDARFFFVRWPLDHIFYSPHFRLIEMRRERHIGSDHFPMFYELALEKRPDAYRETDSVTDEDIEETDMLIAIEKDRERRPAGHDWERPATKRK